MFVTQTAWFMCGDVLPAQGLRPWSAKYSTQVERKHANQSDFSETWLGGAEAKRQRLVSGQAS